MKQIFHGAEAVILSLPDEWVVSEAGLMASDITFPDHPDTRLRATIDSCEHD